MSNDFGKLGADLANLFTGGDVLVFRVDIDVVNSEIQFSFCAETVGDPDSGEEIRVQIIIDYLSASINLPVFPFRFVIFGFFLFQWLTLSRRVIDEHHYLTVRFVSSCI